MNFLYKRSILTRPRIFQEGGSNIFLGDAKPYEVAIPVAGPSANPAVSNKPVEINTTGLADTINRQKDLSYKWAELQYKYKDLESREGRDYLDALREVYKSLGTTEDYIKTMGGTGSMGAYKEAGSAYLSKISDLHSQVALALGRKDLLGYSNGVAQMGQLAAQNADVRFKTTLLDKFLESARKGEMGYNTKRFMNLFFNHMEDPNTTPFDEVVNFGSYAMGVKVQSKDVTSKLDKVFNSLTEKPFSSDVGVEVLPSGIVKKQSKNYIPKVEAFMEMLKSELLADDIGKSILFENGINPDNINQQDLDNYVKGLVEPRYNQYRQRYPDLFYDYSGSISKDINVTGQGDQAKITSIEEGAGADGAGGGKKSKESEWEYQNRVLEAEYRDKYGQEFIDRSDVKSVIGTGANREDIKKELDEIAKRLGKVAAGGAATESSAGVPTTIEGLQSKFGVVLDPTRTKIVNKDGNLYLVTNEEDLKDQLAMIEDSLGVKKDLDDKEVSNITGLKYARGKQWDPTAEPAADEWDTSIFQTEDTNVYNLGPAGAGGATGGAALQPGDDEFVPIDDTNALGVSYPRAKDFNQPVSKGLARRALPVLQDYSLRVTDTSDSNVHKAASQALYKTGFDVNFESEAGNPAGKLPSSQSREKIASVIKGFRAQGLEARYEVKTKANKDALLMQSRGNGWGITEDMVDVVPYITGNHFSVWCEECKKFGAEQSEETRETTTTTSSTTSTEAQGRAKKGQSLLWELIGEEEKVDISNPEDNE